MNKLPIYLASPYTHSSKMIEELRYKAVRENVARLLQLETEHCIYSPIVHCHWMAKEHKLPGDFQFWQRYDTLMIEHLPRFGILKIPGWSASHGVAWEQELALQLQRDVELLEPEGEFFEALKKLS